MPKGRQRDGLLHGDSEGTIHKAKRGRVIGTYSAEPDGVNVEKQLETPPASAAFTPEELEKRIEYYAKCVDGRLPCKGAPAPEPEERSGAA